MADLQTLEAKLDVLDVQLPQMIEDSPDPADFWPAFAGEADVIEDQAGEHAAWSASGSTACWPNTAAT